MAGRAVDALVGGHRARLGRSRSCWLAVLAATVPLGRRVRAQRLEFAWWLAQREATVSGAVVPQVPFQVRCYVRHRGTTPIELTRVEPILATGAQGARR